MRCTLLAVLLGIPLLLTLPSSTSAQPPPSYWPFGCGNGTTCGSKLTSILNQHGPLYNYGPYYGYPPFEPYGPWNAYLQYNPWYYGVPPVGGGGCTLGDLSGHGPCNPSWHSSWLHGGWYHGCSTCGHGGLFTGHGSWHHVTTPCNSCESSPGTPAPPTAPMKSSSTGVPARFTGVGDASDFAGYYNGLPSLDLRVVPASAEEK